MTSVHPNAYRHALSVEDRKPCRRNERQRHRLAELAQAIAGPPKGLQMGAPQAEASHICFDPVCDPDRRIVQRHIRDSPDYLTRGRSQRHPGKRLEKRRIGPVYRTDGFASACQDLIPSRLCGLCTICAAKDDDRNEDGTCCTPCALSPGSASRHNRPPGGGCLRLPAAVLSPAAPQAVRRLGPREDERRSESARTIPRDGMSRHRLPQSLMFMHRSYTMIP